MRKRGIKLIVRRHSRRVHPRLGRQCMDIGRVARRRTTITEIAEAPNLAACGRGLWALGLVWRSVCAVRLVRGALAVN